MDESRGQGRYAGIEFDNTLAAIVAHQKGILKVPAQDWELGKELIVEFFDEEGELIDGYGVRIGQRTKDVRQSAQSDLPFRIQEKGDWVTVEGDGFKIPFNKTTGLIENATSNGTVVISRGPALYVDDNYNHLTGAEVRGKAHNFVLDDNRWTKKDFQIEKIGDQVRCTVNGSYDGIELQLVLTISPNGQTDIYYQAEGEPNGYLREVGLKFVLPEN